MSNSIVLPKFDKKQVQAYLEEHFDSGSQCACFVDEGVIPIKGLLASYNDVSSSFNAEKAELFVQAFVYSDKAFLMIANDRVIGNQSDSGAYDDFLVFIHKIKALG
ncbi:hypothetical protein AB4254_11570 [Vibrio breoganii]